MGAMRGVDLIAEYLISEKVPYVFPIGGLYAASELVGGLFYDSYPGGAGLTAGSVFGRLAGEHAARHAAAGAAAAHA